MPSRSLLMAGRGWGAISSQGVGASLWSVRGGPQLSLLSGDAQPVDDDEEGTGEGGLLGARADLLPVDLLAARAGDVQELVVVQPALVEREQLGGDDVLEGHHRHLLGLDVDRLGAR